MELSGGILLLMTHISKSRVLSCVTAFHVCLPHSWKTLVVHHLPQHMTYLIKLTLANYYISQVPNKLNLGL